MAPTGFSLTTLHWIECDRSVQEKVKIRARHLSEARPVRARHSDGMQVLQIEPLMSIAILITEATERRLCVAMTLLLRILFRDGHRLGRDKLRSNVRI